MSNYERGKVSCECKECGKEFLRYHSTARNAKFCSISCKSKYRIKTIGQDGPKNPSWRGGKKDRICPQCGERFKAYKTSKGVDQKCCSKKCSFDYRFGTDRKPEYPCLRDRRTDAARAWRKAVFERDGYKCYMCGGTKPEIQAHHIIPYSHSRELRNDIENGVTLCLECHQLFHPNFTIASYRKHYGKAYDGPSIYQMAGA